MKLDELYIVAFVAKNRILRHRVSRRLVIKMGLTPLFLLMALVGCSTPGESGPNDPPPDHIRPEEMPNLVIAGLKIRPNYPLVGEQVDIEVSLENRADVTLKKVEVVLNVGDAKIAAKLIDLNPSETRPLLLSWTPNKPGKYRLTVTANSPMKRYERNLDDNEVSSAIVVTPLLRQATDIAITGMKLATNKNETYSLQVTVVNNGEKTVQAPLIIKVDDQTLAETLIGPVSPGDSIYVATPIPEELKSAKFTAGVNPRFRGDETNPNDCTSSEHMAPLEPFSKRHFSACTFSSLAC